MLPPLAPPTTLVLPQGITLIHEYRPSPIVVADVWVDAGTMVELPQEAGLAHFLEHMVFKGSPTLAPGEFDHRVENQGGVTNAATSYDYAHFFVTTGVEHLGMALPLLGELLLEASFPVEEFEREREVVLEELRHAYDSPDWLGFQHLLRRVYGDHPYGRSILGTPQSLSHQTPAHLHRFHRCHYHPGAFTVVIVGGLDLETCAELVSRSFAGSGGRGREGGFCSCQTLDPLPPPVTPVFGSIDPDLEILTLPHLSQSRLLMAWGGPGLKEAGISGPEGLREVLALEVLATVLAAGRSSPWVQELREQRQWVQSISTHCLLQRQSSLFSVTVRLEEIYQERVRSWICDRMVDLSHQPISLAELERAKRLLRNDFIFSTETSSQVASLYGYYATLARLDLAFSYFEVLASLQPEDLCQVAYRYLNVAHPAAIVLTPKG